MNFKRKVMIELVKRDMNMTSLAKELGVTVSYVSELLKGTRVNEERIQQIKKYLNIPPDWKVTDDEEPTDG